MLELKSTNNAPHTSCAMGRDWTNVRNLDTVEVTLNVVVKNLGDENSRK